MNRKLCVITGANAGIGRAAAIQISSRGYHVILACRNPQRGEKALKEVRKKSGSDAVELLQLDMSLKKSIRNFASLIEKKFDRVDVLIHNAGCI